MKLSICIPVYNCDVGQLLSQLRMQMNNPVMEAELLVIDDGSNDSFKTINDAYKTFADWWEDSPVNLGRSKIRNRFLNFATGDYLLFLDCDALIDNQNFIKNYFSAIEKHPNTDVFYGSFKINEAYSQTLRNQYSLLREIPRKNLMQTFEVLQTINFVIKKKCFESIHFDESLTQYGYEDFIFTKQLEANGKSLVILDNPVVHNDNTSNSFFLEKTILGVESLHKLSLKPETKEYIRSIKLYRAAEFFQKTKTVFLVRLFFKIFKNKLIKNLLSNQPRMVYYDLFRLNELLKLMK